MDLTTNTTAEERAALQVVTVAVWGLGFAEVSDESLTALRQHLDVTRAALTVVRSLCNQW
jgi:hypothetical protein